MELVYQRGLDALLDHVASEGLPSCADGLAWLANNRPIIYNNVVCWYFQLCAYKVDDAYDADVAINERNKWFVSCLADSEFAGQICSLPLFESMEDAESYAIQHFNLQSRFSALCADGG